MVAFSAIDVALIAKKVVFMKRIRSIDYAMELSDRNYQSK